MNRWIEDTVEQICVASILKKSKLDSGKRLSLITIDNAVEVALKFYVSYNYLVKESELEGNPGFFNALNAVKTTGKITEGQAKDIRTFHGIRNDLYHRAKLTTVKEDLIEEYVGLAKELLDKTWGFSLSGTEWTKQTAATEKALTAGELELREPVDYAMREVDGLKLVGMKTSAELSNAESIMLTIHGYIMNYARPPTMDEFKKSLMISGRDIGDNVLQVKLANLRKAGLVERGQLKLKANALVDLRKKFFI
jgi:hypothetical protein